MNPTFSLDLRRLRRCNDLSDLARVLGLKPATLAFVLYKITYRKRYKYISIPKKSGGVRQIMAPEAHLKMAQRRLATFLLNIQFDIETSRARSHCILSHGFKRDLSIQTNADLHKGRRFVFNADIKDFFPAINFGRVRGFLIGNEDFLLAPAVATLIAQLACFKNQLPQGAPSSPVISNLIANNLDIRLNRLAKSKRCTYSRYVDDLTFSTNLSDFPLRIAAPASPQSSLWTAGNDLVAAVYKSGFQLNHAKSRMQFSTSRQEVTGLVVNNVINVPVEYVKLVRAMCNRLFIVGAAFEQQQNGRLSLMSNARLGGMLAFIYQIKSRADDPKR